MELVKNSSHPISKGVYEFLSKNIKYNQKEIKDFKEIKAKGIEAIIDGKKVVAGNKDFLIEKGIKVDIDNQNSLFLVAIENRVVAIFELNDEIKEGAAEAIEKIKELGIKVVMLTGDNEKVAKKVAKEVGVDEYFAKLLPQDKAKFIDDFHRSGDIVVMAGDGINDSIALSCSDIAIAMGSGADIAISVSDVVLLDESPKRVYEAFKISKKVFKKVKQNLALSLIYNTFAVPLAVMGFVNPLVAAISMSLSSLLVVGNSFGIKLKDKK